MTERFPPEFGSLWCYLMGAGALARTLVDQRRSPIGLRKAQERRLRRLVRHAYENVHFYRTLFDRAGIHPSEIQTIADLERIPVTTREHLKSSEAWQTLARGAKLHRCLEMVTSGSSGVPLKIPWSQESLVSFFAVSIRAHLALGSRLTDTILSIGPRYYPDGLRLQKMGLAPVHLVSPFLEASELIRILNEIRPEILLSYPSVLEALIGHVEGSGTAVFQPRILITSGELLTKKVASASERVFGVVPYQLYGSWEMGRIAW